MELKQLKRLGFVTLFFYVGNYRMHTIVNKYLYNRHLDTIKRLNLNDKKICQEYMRRKEPLSSLHHLIKRVI